MSLNPIIDFHCHGVGKYNFTNTLNHPLHLIQGELSRLNSKAVITFFLKQDQLSEFEVFAARYSDLRRGGKLDNILGLSIEGPLLASSGGTPIWASWAPSRSEWERISALGKHGLIYVVYSMVEKSSERESLTDGNILEILLENGVTPALGHFTKADPQRTADSIYMLYDYAEKLGSGPLLSDHMFNDMPLRFKHAWRTQSEKQNRAADLLDLDLDSVTLDDADERLGVVPTALMKGAREGKVKLCMNFDGGHVDLAVCRKTVELVGADNLFMMTDKIPGASFAGQKLVSKRDSPLLFRPNGVVAGSSCTPHQQVLNMADAGFDKGTIDQIVYWAPKKYLENRGIIL